MAEQRFIVTETWGFAIHPNAASGGSRKPTPSYSVLDTCNAYREVGAYYTSKQHPSVAANERLAYALARLLNRQDRNHEAKYVDNVYAD